MKKLILFFSAFLLLLLSVNAQKRTIQMEIAAFPSDRFSSIDLFRTKAITPDKVNTLGEYTSNFQLLEVDTAALSAIADGNIPALEVNLPFNGAVVTLQLIESGVVDKQTVFFSRNRSGKTPVSYTPGAYYYGVIKDRSNTLVAISFFNNTIIGVIADDTGNHVLGKSNTLDNESNEYILYNEKDLLVKDDAECITDDEITTDKLVIPEEQTQMAGSCNGEVGVYIETDHQVYINQGSNQNNVLNFVTGLFNVTTTIYQNESITTSISEVNVWTVADPYIGPLNTSQEALGLFANEMSGGFNGDLAHLFSARGLGGGRAYIDVLCASNYYKTAVSGNLNNATPAFPTYSWNAMVVTHEMGHNLGSWHTHDCKWNGNDTAIDGCGTVVGCPDPGLPAGGGTIMSYCHINVGIDFNLGFGPQPGDVIRNHVNNAPCLECCVSDNVVDQDVLGGNTDHQEASQTITATNTIFNNGTAIYHAGQQVLLQSGFHAQNGAVFHAYIEGCTGVFQAKMQTQDTKTQDQVTYNTPEGEQAVEANSEEDLDGREFIVFPNPFTDVINFKYTVKEQDSPVLLKIYNAMGEEITTLVREQRLTVGIYHAQFNGSGRPAGIYLYRLEIGDTIKKGKIILKK